MKSNNIIKALDVTKLYISKREKFRPGWIDYQLRDTNTDRPCAWMYWRYNQVTGWECEVRFPYCIGNDEVDQMQKAKTFSDSIHLHVNREGWSDMKVIMTF